MRQVQGFNFDSEGEYVRHWLPELARVPTEWIHHPWDAPSSVLKAAGVELGLNYPKPIIDVDVARERLTEAIFIMRGTESVATANNSNGADEVVFDNSDCNANLAIPKPIPKQKAPCPSSSSHDQKVPSFHNVSVNKKRPKLEEDVRPVKDTLHFQKNEGAASKMDDDLCSTAESSSMKKQNTATSSLSFSVPEAISISTSGKSIEDHESYDNKLQKLKDCEIDETSSKRGMTATCVFITFFISAVRNYGMMQSADLIDQKSLEIILHFLICRRFWRYTPLK